MPQHPVRIAVRIIDHLSNAVTQNLTVSGSYDSDEGCLRYTEPDPVADVTLTLRETAATLVRRSEWTTVLELDRQGTFRVDSAQGALSGDLVLVAYHRTESSVTLEYRLLGPQGELAHTTYTLNFKGTLS
jgi:hypothetical protein